MILLEADSDQRALRRGGVLLDDFLWDSDMKKEKKRKTPVSSTETASGEHAAAEEAEVVNTTDTSGLHQTRQTTLVSVPLTLTVHMEISGILALTYLFLFTFHDISLWERISFSSLSSRFRFFTKC